MGCLFLGKVVLKIDPQLGRLVSKEEALAHLDHCQEAGLVHLIGRNKIDSVWTSATPKEDLMTICNCCPCCCLWKMLPQLDLGISSKIRRLPGVHLTVDPEKCVGCGKCVEGCYVKAVTLVGGKAVINQDVCKGCARCAHGCSEKAITLHLEDLDFIAHAVESLTPLVDVSKE
ncbi:MAG: 4Fe-4S binding protein [Methanomassiliicoccales archaeon]|nr:4Fe-4S binding protein [Methanomassiliicoccales archaeon]